MCLGEILILWWENCFVFLEQGLILCSGLLSSWFWFCASAFQGLGLQVWATVTDWRKSCIKLTQWQSNCLSPCFPSVFEENWKNSVLPCWLHSHFPRVWVTLHIQSDQDRQKMFQIPCTNRAFLQCQYVDVFRPMLESNYFKHVSYSPRLLTVGTTTYLLIVLGVREAHSFCFVLFVCLFVLRQGFSV